MFDATNMRIPSTPGITTSRISWPQIGMDRIVHHKISLREVNLLFALVGSVFPRYSASCVCSADVCASGTSDVVPICCESSARVEILLRVLRSFLLLANHDSLAMLCGSRFRGGIELSLRNEEARTCCELILAQDFGSEIRLYASTPRGAALRTEWDVLVVSILNDF